MNNTRRQFPAEFKGKIALEAVKEIKTVSQIASEHDLHPNLVSKWRQDLLTQIPVIFERKNAQAEHLQAQEQKMTALYEQIGRLTTQLAWIKKKSGLEPDVT